MCIRDRSNAINCSAKTGEGIEDILEAVVSRIPHPQNEVKSLTKALIFDSYYDPYRGVIVYFRVIAGSINKRTRSYLWQVRKTMS